MNENKELACFGIIAVAVVGSVIGAIVNGWVLSILWEWFVVPLFDVPTLTTAAAIGFALVIGLLTHQESQTSDKRKDTSEIIAGIVGRAILSPLVVLMIGSIVKMFI